MANVKAFKALRYDVNKCGNIADVVAPPYDIISAQEQADFYKRSDYNVIRLEYGLTSDADTDTDNRYTRAKACLDDWMENGVLKKDDQECLYLYEQEFNVNKQHYIYRGFVTLVELEEFSKKIVLPHEETLSKAKTDRFNLMSATNANFSQIYCLYMDEEKKIDAVMNEVRSTEPEVDFVYDNGIRQRLWPVSDNALIKTVTEAFKDKQLFIADGHHRYETALNYRNKMREENPDWKADDPFNFVMMMLVDIDDPGLVVFPTHRMVNNVNADEAMTISFLKDDFLVEKIIVDKRASELAQTIEYDLTSTNDSKIYAMYFGDNYYYRIRLLDTSVMDSLLPDRSVAYRNLDVTILHTLILEKIFKISTADMANQKNLTYTRDMTEAIEAVQKGAQQCCVILNPTKVHEIKDVSIAGEKMPQKSTYFYPKLITGLVMNKF